MKHVTRFAISISLALIAAAAAAQINAPGYKVDTLVKPSAFHGIHGMTFDAEGKLFAGSVVGESVYRIDVNSGKVETIVGPPDGMADDLVFLPDGTMVWTAINQNAVRARKGNGPIRVLAKDLASPNSINFRKSDGRLFVAQVFGGDGLWELDPAGVKPPRNILQDMGGLNGFDIGPDGWIYGPLWFKKQVVKINPDTGELKIVAQGFHTPAAANFDSKWNLYVLDTALGTVNHVDIKTGAKKVVAQLSTSLDNLAIDAKDRLFVSNMADNGIQEVNVKTGAARSVIKGQLAIPLGIAAVGDGKQDVVYVADVFALRAVDSKGRVTDLQRSHADGAHIDYPVGVSASAQHILVINSNGTLQKYDRAGKLLTEWKGLSGLSSAAELSDGSVLFAQMGGLYRIAANGERKVVATGVDGAQGITPIDTQNVYLTYPSGNQILRLNIATGAKQVIASNLNIPQGLAVDNSGQPLVVEFGSKRLLSIDPASGKKTVIATGLNIGVVNRARPQLPIGLAVGVTGAIYVVSDVENAIYKLTKQ